MMKPGLKKLKLTLAIALAMSCASISIFLPIFQHLSPLIMFSSPKLTSLTFFSSIGKVCNCENTAFYLFFAASGYSPAPAGAR
jgi:hypothetical protein